VNPNHHTLLKYKIIIHGALSNHSTDNDLSNKSTSTDVVEVVTNESTNESTDDRRTDGYAQCWALTYWPSTENDK
jgi:hypothetical protein